MPELDYNRETNDRKDCVDRRFQVSLNGGTFEFVQPLPRYISDKLTSDDWAGVVADLKGHRDAVVRRAALSGSLFLPGGLLAVQQAIVQGCKTFIHRRFKTRQIQAGDLAWSVPSLLLGDRYK